MANFLDDAKATAKRTLACTHVNAVIVTGGAQWCPDCGAIKDGAFWQKNKAIEFLGSIASIFGLNK